MSLISGTQIPKDNQKIKLDTAASTEAANFFTGTSGISCTLTDSDGLTVYESSPDSTPCAACKTLCDHLGCSFNCAGLHPFAARQSERFGGRYIYFCPIGMAFFASPIHSAGV